MSPVPSLERKQYTDYTVGWVCALVKEQTAATALLDQRHADLRSPPNDTNTYTLGSIGEHNIVIACLPMGSPGNCSATQVAASMIQTYTQIRIGLMVGIGGGIPSKVRLGDVVVSTPVGKYSGVVQWDLGKAESGGSFRETGSLNRPPTILLTALTKLRTDHELYEPAYHNYLLDLKTTYPRLDKYVWSERLKDPWRAADAEPTTDRNERTEDFVTGVCSQREEKDFRIIFGLIASGNQVIKDAELRDKISQRYEGELLCVEMEAAGLMNEFPCLVIRGICDYADERKNDDWQEYAAARAAALAKDLLYHVQSTEVEGQRAAKDVITKVQEVQDAVAIIEHSTDYARKRLRQEEHNKLLSWLADSNYGSKQSDHKEETQEGTGIWFLESHDFQHWLNTKKQTLFCEGMPGAGKTKMTSIVVDSLEQQFAADPTIGLVYVYCYFKEKRMLGDLLASLLKQLASGRMGQLKGIEVLRDKHSPKGTRPSPDELSEQLHLITPTYSRVFILTDALDECDLPGRHLSRLANELIKLQESYNVNNFSTSRHDLKINKHFQAGKFAEIRASDSDVAKYLENRVNEMASLARQDKAQSTTTITEAAQGMFLLAELFIKSLPDSMTPNDIRRSLSALPKRPGLWWSDSSRPDRSILTKAYEYVMDRIRQHSKERLALAKSVISWLASAAQPLQATELQHAMATKPGATKFDLGDLISTTDLVSACAGLVVFDKNSGRVRLVHHTVQDYFDQAWSVRFPDSHPSILETCVTYLTFAEFATHIDICPRDYRTWREQYPFSRYAAEFWRFHARPDSMPSDAFINLLLKKAKVNAIYQMMEFGSQERRTLNPTGCNMRGVHLASYCGLSRTAEVLLARRENATHEDAYGHTPMWYAVMKGNESIIDLLLANGVDPNGPVTRWGGTALYIATEAGDIRVVKKLLEEGAEADARPAEAGPTPLMTALELEKRKIVELLIKAGVNVNAMRNPTLIR